MEELKGSEFLLDGYITRGEAKEITIGGCNYSLQYYQGDHEDEYTLTRAGKVCLFQNGILKMYYELDADENEIGDFTRFENGCVAVVQSFDEILDQHYFHRIINHVRGE